MGVQQELKQKRTGQALSEEGLFANGRAAVAGVQQIGWWREI